MAMRDVSGVVDFAILERMTGGQDDISAEVLDLFVQQTKLWGPMLQPDHEGLQDALHTLRGAAAGIGANALAEICGQVERADPALMPEGLLRVSSALDGVLMDVAAYRHELMLRSLRG